MGLYCFKVPGPGCLTMGYASEVRGYASGYALRSVKTTVSFSEGMLQGVLRGYASPKSNIPALHKLDT